MTTEIIPNADIQEAQLTAAILSDGDNAILQVEALQPVHCLSVELPAVLMAARSLHAEDLPLTHAAIAHRIGLMGKLDAIGGNARLIETVMDHWVPAVKLNYLAYTIIEAWERRKRLDQLAAEGRRLYFPYAD